VSSTEVMDPPKKEHKKSERKKDGKGHRKRSTSKKKDDNVVEKERPVKKEEIISDAKPAVAASKEKKEPQTMDAKETVGDYVCVLSVNKEKWSQLIFHPIDPHQDAWKRCFWCCLPSSSSLQRKHGCHQAT